MNSPFYHQTPGIKEKNILHNLTFLIHKNNVLKQNILRKIKAYLVQNTIIDLTDTSTFSVMYYFHFYHRAR